MSITNLASSRGGSRKV